MLAQNVDDATAGSTPERPTMRHLRGHAPSTGLAVLFSIVTAACGSGGDGSPGRASADVTGGAPALTGAGATGGSSVISETNPSGGARIPDDSRTAGGASASGAAGEANEARATAGSRAANGESPSGGTRPAGGSSAAGGANVSGAAEQPGGARPTGGAPTADGGTPSGGARPTGGSSAAGGASGAGEVERTGGASAEGGSSGANGGDAPGEPWPNIRVVDNHLCDRWGRPFAVRSIESMFGNGTSNATAFAASHKALGANTMSPLPNSSVSSAADIERLLAAAYENGLIIGLNADHTNQGERFFQSTQIQTVVNRYPNVFLQEAVELGSDVSESQWVQAAKDKVDAYVGLYPDKPMKIGSPFGGRSPRPALDRCQEVVDYYTSKGGRGGLIFTCQLYWRASTADWSYQEENGFSDGLPGIIEAVDAMADSPCMFMPGLDNQDDVGYTGWREIMDHVRESNADPDMRLSFQWWVYYNSGDPYDNDLTTNAGDALSGITSTGRDVKEKLEMDRRYVELGPLDP